MQFVSGTLGWVAELVLACFVVAAALVLVRLKKGPTLADRVVALDVLGYVLIGFIAVYALGVAKEAYLDVATTLSLIAFVATVAFARFVARMGRREKD